MTSMKKLEEKLDKKKARLKKMVAEKAKLEIKIKEFRADIEKLQAIQFEQFKKAAKKENIEIRTDDIPDILQLIKNFQQDSVSEHEAIVADNAVAKSSHTGVTDVKAVPQNSLRTISSLESIESLE